MAKLRGLLVSGLLVCVIYFVPTSQLLAEANAPGEAESIKFWVYGYDSKGHIVGRPAVKAFRIYQGISELVGTTDIQGEVTLKTRVLFSKGASALLFCGSAEAVTCSALRLDIEFLQGFREFNVRLVESEIVDRMKVSRKKERKHAG